MSYCCQNKKYFSELCPACIQAMTTTNIDSMDYPHYSDYSSVDWPGSTSMSNCECGSEIVNGPGHSHWCPKYEK